MEEIARVPIVRLIHGRKDHVCPVEASYLFEAHLRAAMLQRGIAGDRLKTALKSVRPAQAGHDPQDPDLVRAMVACTDEIRDIRLKERAINRRGGGGLPDHA